MEQTLISVIVPVYGVEKYLDKCIASIVNQTYQNLEIILVDDGSPDNCPVICDAWAAKDSRVRVIHKKNGGLSDARNAGMVMAKGEFISFIDSDDYIAPDFINKLYATLVEQEADVVECAVLYVDEEEHALRQRSAAPVVQMDKMEALRRLVTEDGIFQTVWNKLYRRDIMMDISFEVGKYNEDEFWTYQVFDRIETLAVVHEPLYYYLQRNNSIIGVGYNIRRLDGLEARYRRMRYLQKYDELAILTRQQLLMDCMWHYQCVISVLNNQDKIAAQNYICSVMQKIPVIKGKQLTGKITHRLWIMLFRLMPKVTALLRNKMRIGE